MSRDGCRVFFASHQIAAIDLTKPKTVGHVPELASARMNDTPRHPRRRLNDEADVAPPVVKTTGTRLCGRAGFF
jgi:hypothetical protein